MIWFSGASQWLWGGESVSARRTNTRSLVLCLLLSCVSPVVTATDTGPAATASGPPTASGQAEILEALERDGRVVLERAGVEVRGFDVESDGHRVEAIRFAPVTNAPRPGVMLVPGFGRSARDYFPLGMQCARAGYVCVALSQPGFGRSEGSPDFAGPRTVAALASVLTALRADPGVRADWTAAFGYSRGALAVASLATQDSALKAVVLAGGIYDFETAYNQISSDAIRANMREEAGMDAAAIAARSPLRRVTEISAAVLILHGEEDQAAPLEQAVAFSRQLQQRGKKSELRTYPGLGHGLSMPELSRALFGFLGEHLSPGDAGPGPVVRLLQSAVSSEARAEGPSYPSLGRSPRENGARRQGL